MNQTDSLFDIKGRVAVLTGGGGVICATLARELAARGARVAVLDLAAEAAERVAAEVREAGGEAVAVAADVLDRDSLAAAAAAVEEALGPPDILVNGAGGNKPQATAMGDLTFFDLPADALRFVIDLNLMGSILPSQVIGRRMAERKEGVIVNISSMSATRALTRVVGYSVAKAGIDCLTRWLAVYVAREYSPGIRVNAIAPGFLETNQNRFLLREEDTGALSARGQTIIDHTPMARFGDPGDLVGALLWLASPASAFVTGIVVPVDGGFSAYSGV